MKEQIVKYLRDLGNYIIDPEEEHYGICFNLSQEFPKLRNAYDIVSEAAVGWEHHSGLRSFPVPYIYQPTFEYWSCESPVGRLRRDLCLYVADWIEDNYDETTS